MFETIAGTADPIENASDSRLSASRQSDIDAVERASLELGLADHEKTPTPSERPASLKRTASHALSRVTCHVSTRSITDLGPPPNGGLKAWTQIAMGWLCVLVTWAGINSFGAFQEYCKLTLHVSPLSTSWIGTIQNFLSFFIGAFSGSLLDAGYYYLTIVIGMTLQLLGAFMMSLPTKYWQLLLTQGVLTKLAGGIYFTPCIGIMATYFSKHRAFAFGQASTGDSVGGMLYPVVVRSLLPKLGFAWSGRVLGFVNLGCLALEFSLIRPRLPPRKSGALIDFGASKEPA